MSDNPINGATVKALCLLEFQASVLYVCRQISNHCTDACLNTTRGGEICQSSESQWRGRARLQLQKWNQI